MAIRQSRKTFREWALKYRRLSFAEILAEAERAGYPPTNCGRCLCGVNDSLVRVDKENFVSDEQIQFDVSLIDPVLEQIVGCRAVPTAAVTSRDLMLLPKLADHVWNPYLLVSYCWRFSELFQLLCYHTYPHYNLVGAIVRKDLKYVENYGELAYEMLLTDVVGEAGIQLDGTGIDQWLMDCGWIHRFSGVGRRIAVRIQSRGDKGELKFPVVEHHRLICDATMRDER